MLKSEFEKALTKAGHKISAEAEYILNFEVRDEIGALSTTGRRHIISLEGRGGRGGGEDAKARVNVYDSASGGLLNKGEASRTRIKRSAYRIDATLEDRASGKALWQAWAIAELRSSSGDDLTRRMVPAIVDRFGRTTREQPFSPY